MGRPQQGFTLLEMIAAIVVLAVAFSSLLMLAGRSRQLQAQAQQQTEAVLYARSVLDSAFVTEPLVAGNRHGELADGYRWNLHSELVDPGSSTSQSRLFRLDLTIAWGSLTQPRSAHFSTLRVVPMANSGGAS